MCQGTSEYISQINDSLYLFVMHSTSYPLYTLHLQLSFQCHLHFPRIHYRAVAICMAFIPQVAPHMEITQYIPSENIAVEFWSTNHQLHCYLVITSLFYVWNHSTMGLQIEKANYLTNVHLLSWGGHDFFSPLFLPCALPLSSTAGRQKEVRTTEVLFFLVIYSWIFHLIFMPFQDYLGAEENLLPRRRPRPKIRFQLQWAQRMKGREREIDREGTRERGFMCSLVNERQALKVTGCVYYWSVSRLMGRGEEKREERAALLSREPEHTGMGARGSPKQ